MSPKKYPAHWALLFAFAVLGAAFPSIADAAPNVTVDCAGSGGVNMDVKHGRAFLVDSPTSTIDGIVNLGLTLAMFEEHMVCDTGVSETPNQFYLNGGAVTVRANTSTIVPNRQYAFIHGLEIFHQCSGTPYYGEVPQGSFSRQDLYSIDTSRVWTDGGNWYPIPVAAQRASYGAKLAEWMQAVETADGNIPCVWLGTQEPSHTLGFLNGVNSPANIQDNISVYIDTWLPTALSMHAAGYEVGGVQLNGSNAAYINFAVNELKLKGCVFDYLTFQQYKETNSDILTNARSALTQYGYSTAKKVFYDRFALSGTVGANWYTSSSGIVHYLIQDQVIEDNADMVYGYCIDGPALDNANFGQVLQFVNRLAVARRPVTLAANLGATIGSDANKYTAVVWNSGTAKAITMKLNNCPAGYSGKTLTVRIGSGTALTTSTTATWSSGTSQISGFSIPQNGYALISLQ